MSLHFVLDGYNLVKQDAHLAVLKLEAGRLALLKLIVTRQLQGSSSNQVTVVFDGQMGETQEHYSAGIDIVYTSFETADDWIKRFVEDSATPRNIVVVTDDKEIRCFVRALGAVIMGTREFLEGRGSRRRQADLARKLKRVQTEKKEISSVVEHKITSELSEFWLKGHKR
jgi:predicted RNA-binding protein with PIN domain